jgi:hypothetical protein
MRSRVCQREPIPFRDGIVEETKKSPPISRREFARRAAIASAATLVPATAFSTTPAPSLPPQQPSNLPKLSPESQTGADSRTQAVLAQYGSRLSDDQRTEISRLAAVSQRQLDHIRAFPTENGDDSALYLKPLMEREKKPTPAANAKPAPTAPKN